jgi:hypothetical protein
MKTKAWFTVVALSFAPLAFAANKAEYPTQNVAGFVIEKLDVTSLPSAFRPNKEKGKKTLSDYGFTAQAVNQNAVVLASAGGEKKVAIKVLDQNSSGIYVCVAEPGEEGTAKTQSVIMLKRNDPSALLKGRESFREFAACPVIGASKAVGDVNAG